MKLASLRHPHKPDGLPLLVSQDNTRAVPIDDLTPSIREAVENWDSYVTKLEARSKLLNKGEIPLSKKMDQLSHIECFEVKEEALHSPLPRAFQWADGSAFIQHIKLVRKARNAELPATLLTVPLMYQGGSDSFLAPREDIPLIDPAFGLDFEGEVAVVTSFVPMGISPERALHHIRLLLIVNDVTLRGLVPDELAQGFGFFQSKPASAFGPFAVTPDELGGAWREGRVHLPLLSELNGKFFGNPDAGEMHFHFGQLIAHAARTRDLSAGTIIGSGTVSNEDSKRGASCIAEIRMLEKINTGEIKSPFMKHGDHIKIEMKDLAGRNIFGTIHQRVAERRASAN